MTARWTPTKWERAERDWTFTLALICGTAWFLEAKHIPTQVAMKSRHTSFEEAHKRAEAILSMQAPALESR